VRDLSKVSDSAILKMGREEILNLRLSDVTRPITSEEFFHMSEELDALWRYDYVAADRGKLGFHAELNAGQCSDLFFISRLFLSQGEMLQIMAWQVINQLLPTIKRFKLDCVAGVPKGATDLAKEVAHQLQVGYVSLVKVDGQIILEEEIGARSLGLFEDATSTGKGFRDALEAVYTKEPEAKILRCDPTILNRGGFAYIRDSKERMYRVVPVVDHRANSWPPSLCPLCKRGSKPIKPKITDENWKLITTSQL